MTFYVYAFILFTASGVASANSITHYVSPGGELNSISMAVQLANEGDTISVDGGSYNEKIVLNKSIKLIGKNRPKIIGNGTGTVVRVSSPHIVIRGFHISGSGESLNSEDCGILLEDSPNSIVENNILEDVLFGIYLKNSPGSEINKNKITGKDLDIPDRGDSIRLWYSSGTAIKGNRIHKTRDLVMWWSGDTVIEDNIVEEGRYGLHYMYSNNNIFKNNVFRANLVGGFLMYSKNIRFENNIFIQNQGIASGYGVGFKDIDLVTAVGNKFIDNRVGIYMDNTPTSYNIWNTLEDNKIAFNDIGVSLMPSIERNRIIKNNFIDNNEQVEVRGGGTLKGNQWFANNEGNYWSDYKGYDNNNDGIGDFPYVAESLFEDMIDRNSVLRVFIHSPVTQALDIASKAFPVFRPAPKLKDEYPLISPTQSHIVSDVIIKFNLTVLLAYSILIAIPLLALIILIKPYKGQLIDRNN
jgi:nitrous oxidase accessory protein